MIKNVALDFPLCADPRRDGAIRPVFERAVAFLLERVGATHLESIILTGSLARGEGSVLLKPDGFRLLGDVEFLVILRSPFDWGALRRRMVELSRQATRELGEDGRLATFEYAPAGIGYLQKTIRPCIFAYDLLHHGKVVWGRSDMLGEIRRFEADAIPREDAVRLIMNRMTELLFQDVSERNGLDHVGRSYQLVKTILDMAGSSLAFAGEYVSPYAERQKPFVNLLASNPDLRGTLPVAEEFQEELNLATQRKLFPTVELLPWEGLPQRLATVLTWAKVFWLWEMRRLLNRPDGQFIELVEGYMRREPFQQRLKGWVKFLGHPLRPAGELSWRRMARLLPQASPHTLTYTAALLAYEGMVEGREDWKTRAGALLPVPVQSGNGDVLRDVGELWRWLIRNN